MEEKKEIEQEVEEIAATVNELPAEQQARLQQAIMSLLAKSMLEPQGKGASKIGITRKNKSLSKARRKMSKNSRRRNRGN